MAEFLVELGPPSAGSVTAWCSLICGTQDLFEGSWRMLGDLHTCHLSIILRSAKHAEDVWC